MFWLIHRRKLQSGWEKNQAWPAGGQQPSPDGTQPPGRLGGGACARLAVSTDLVHHQPVPFSLLRSGPGLSEVSLTLEINDEG